MGNSFETDNTQVEVVATRLRNTQMIDNFQETLLRV